MEKRTLVKSGASSFNVALPINWVRRNKLEKGSVVSIDENDTGDLVLSVEREMTAMPQTNYTIKMNKDTAKLLHWELLRAYLRNYNTINLEGQNVSSSASSELKNLNAFIGLDAIEQTKGMIVLKNFSAQDKETSPYVLIKKVDVGVRAMIELIQTFPLTGFSHDKVLDVALQHENNERIYLFALKVTNNITDNPSLMRMFKTDYRQLMREYMLLRSMRQISSRFSQIGTLLLLIEHKGKAGKLLDEMFGTLYKKYRTVIALPKNPVSKEMIDLLNDSKEHVRRWETMMKETKSQPLHEIFLHCISINKELDQLGMELI